MIRTNVTRQDSGLWNRIKRVARDYTTKVEVGYFGNQTHSGKRPITMKTLASFHEYGTRKMPARPFIRPALKQNRMKYLKLAGKQITPCILGRQTTSNVWHLLGAEAVKDVQDYMINGTFAPLKPATIKRKGSSKPLIDTGQLRQSITYKVK